MNNLLKLNTNIKLYQYDTIEEKCMEKINILIDKYPFKWEKFINKILSNNEITYFENNNIIIKLDKLKENDIETIMFFSKEILLTKGITKIICKKDIIILKFYSEKIYKIFSENNTWMSLSYYFTIKKYFPNQFINFGCILVNNNINNNENEEIELIFELNNEFYLFNTNKILKANLDNNYHQYLIYLFKEKRFIDEKILKINYSFNEKTRLNTINKLVKKEIFS